MSNSGKNKRRMALPGDDLFLKQQLSDLLYIFAVFSQQFRCPDMRVTCPQVLASVRGGAQVTDLRNHLPHLEVQHFRCFLTERLGPALARAFTTAITDRTNDCVHAVIGTSLERHAGDFLKVVLSTRGDVLLTEENLF